MLFKCTIHVPKQFGCLCIGVGLSFLQPGFDSGTVQQDNLETEAMLKQHLQSMTVLANKLDETQTDLAEQKEFHRKKVCVSPCREMNYGPETVWLSWIGQFYVLKMYYHIRLKPNHYAYKHENIGGISNDIYPKGANTSLCCKPQVVVEETKLLPLQRDVTCC